MSDEELDFLKKGIRFIRKPAKTGPRYVFNIPKAYIENGFIDPDKTYVIYLAEKREDLKGISLVVFAFLDRVKFQ